MHTFGYNGKHYLVPELWEFAKDRPVQNINTPSHLFKTMIVDRCWGSLIRKNGKWVTSELTMLELTNHVKKILAADTSYPIICLTEGRILDGLHRVSKNIINNVPKTKAVVLSLKDIEVFVKEHKPAKEAYDERNYDVYFSCEDFHCSL